jgi:cholesterol oxidase
MTNRTKSGPELGGGVTRRQIVQASVATGLFAQSGAGMSFWGVRREDPEYRGIIVVGSGFGGAVTAHRLTQKGHQVTMLERGQRWDLKSSGRTFSRLIPPDRRSTWLNNWSPLPVGPRFPVERYTGVLENRTFGDLNVLAGAGYGGGSIVYGGVYIKPKAELLRQVFPQEVSPEDLKPYFDRAAVMMRQSLVPDDIVASDSYTHARVMKDECDRAGIPTERVPAAMDWDLVRDEIAGKISPSVIAGEAVHGVNSGAKITLDRTYLGFAESTGLLDVRTLHQVKSIGMDADGRYTLEVEEMDEYGQVIRIRPMICDYLFLNGGVMGTTELLLKAREEGTLPWLNEQVGAGFGNNGNCYALRLGVTQSLGWQQAGPPVYSIDATANPITPVFIEHPQLPVGFDIRALIYFSVGINPTRGRFTYDRSERKLNLSWPKGEENGQSQINQILLQYMDKLNKANGGWTSSAIDLFRRPFNDNAVYHALGGCVMGEACDFYGRVKNYKRLYVTDGALIPGSTACTNPSMTITAVAERCLENIVKNDF